MIAIDFIMIRKSERSDMNVINTRLFTPKNNLLICKVKLLEKTKASVCESHQSLASERGGSAGLSSGKWLKEWRCARTQMDVDADVDSQLLQQFSSMATTDREVLIAEFRRLLGNQMNEDGCVFFLDMNNWNLQAAVCSYFEYEVEQPTVARTPQPQMAFVKDVTIGEGESIPPSTRFVKTWRLQNTGVERWPFGCYLKYVSGDKFGPVDRVDIDSLEPGMFADVSVEMISPQRMGIYEGQWRMCAPSGFYIGECIWVILQVDEGGVLGVTQLLSHFGSEFLESRPDQTSSVNPFSGRFNSSMDQQNCRQLTPTTPRNDVNDVISSPGQMPPVNNSRHSSSLPSSPRWLGEADSCPTHFPSDSLRSRVVLFQTPDNSPSKTISVRSSSLHPTNSDMDSMEMS